MLEPTDAMASRIAREIEVFGDRGIPAHTAALAWRNETFLRPALLREFGVGDVHGVYASCIADAIARTGNPIVYSLGCGEGQEELTVLARADAMGLPPFRIIGLDLSPIACARANKAAAAAGMAARFTAEVRDLNAGLPGTGLVAACMAHHCLHHIVELEALFAMLAARLHGQGSFITFDMIGRNGHRRWPEVMGYLRRLWPTLPAEKHHDFALNKPMPFYQDWDCAILGFEGVRAQDVLPAIAQHFVPARMLFWGGLSDVFLNYRSGPAFDPARPDDLAFLSAIQQLETRLLGERRTTPNEIGAEFRPRHGGHILPQERENVLRRSLRRAGEFFPPLDDVPLPAVYPPQPAWQPPVLPTDERLPFITGSTAAASLMDGFDPAEADGVWAIMDEQHMTLRFAAPVRAVSLLVYTVLPAMRAQHITAEALSCRASQHGPLQPQSLIEVALIAEEGPRAEWRLRLFNNAYRHPDTDGGADPRPLAYRLLSVMGVT